MLTRRLGPSPPPPQPCEALIFSNYAQARPTLAHWREGHHSPKITFHRTSPTSPDIFSPHNISIPCERNQSTKLLCAAGLSALAGTAALWPGGCGAWRAPARRSLEAPPGDFGSLLLLPPGAKGEELLLLEAAALASFTSLSSSSQTPITSCRPSRNGVEKEETVRGN